MTETIENSSYLANLLQNAVRNAPVAPDDNLPRYGMSFLLPLALMNQKGSNFIGDFNPKIDGDPNRGNLVNINYYPAFELIAFYGGRADIPFERNPTYTDDIVTPEEFDFGGFNNNSQKGVNFIDRNARQCAEVAIQEFAETGYKEFKSLVGFHFNDADRGLSACDKLIQLILPIKDLKQFPKATRIKNGFPFYSPFLDVIDEYLRKESMKRIMSMELKPETKDVAQKLYLEIRDGVSNGLKIANRILNETEAEMKNPNGVRKGYDEPNLQYDDAPVPTDLYCLAHTDRTELDNKQLAASSNIGSEIARPISEAFEGFKEALLGRPAPPTMPTDVLTGEEVQILLEQQREDFEARMAAMEARFAPPFVDEVPPKTKTK